MAALSACSDLDPIVGPRAVRTSPRPGLGQDAGIADDGGNTVLPGEVSFREQIRPLIERPPRGDLTGKGCKNCHDSREASHVGIDFGGFDCATLGALREGGGSTGRRIIVPFHPETSAFITKLTGEYGIGARMPKNGPPFWSDAEVALVARWIAEGAKGADDE